MRLFLVLSLSLAGLAAPAWAADPAQAGAAPDGLRVAVGDWCPPGESPGSDCVVRPELIHAVTPDYPEVARRSRFTGKVDMEVVVSEFGDVIRVELLVPNPIFESSAVAAVKQRRYKPAYRDGVPVAVRVPITVRYGLEGAKDRAVLASGAVAEDVSVALEDARSFPDGGKREDRSTSTVGGKSPR